MKASPTMQQLVQRLVEQHGVDLTPVGAFLRLDLPAHDSLLIDHLAHAQIAVTGCFEECGVWKIEREVIFFTGDTDWIPLEVTQLATGWTAYARLDADGTQIVRINHCGQEKLAEFTERWAQTLLRQNWLEQGVRYQPWTPPFRKELR
jgi:hypothetical protein